MYNKNAKKCIILKFFYLRIRNPAFTHNILICNFEYISSAKLSRKWYLPKIPQYLGYGVILQGKIS
jgi:hypothetical protein